MRANQIAGLTLAAVLAMGSSIIAQGEELQDKQVEVQEQVLENEKAPEKLQFNENKDGQEKDALVIPENLSDENLLQEAEQVAKENQEKYEDTLSEAEVPLVVTPEDYIPVLMYHHFVTDEDLPPGNGAIVKIDEFEEHLQTFVDEGYTFISLEEMNDILLKAIKEKDDLTRFEPQRKVDPQLHLDKKYIVLTIDDGYRSNYELAYPLLKKYNAKADISVITSRIHTSYVIAKEIEKLCWKDLNEMQESGLVQIHSHTYDHVPATEKIYTTFRAAVQMGEKNLNDKLKERSKVRVLTYPNGLYNQMSQGLLREMGYDLQLTTEAYVVNRNTLVNRIPRVTVDSGMTGQQVLERIEAAANRTFQSTI